MPYATPTADALKTLYPAFATVADATIDAQIADAEQTGVDETWLEDDYQPAVMALAAHNMALLGIGSVSKAESYARQGVTSLKSGSFSASFDADRAKAVAAGEYSATPYGQRYDALLRKNKGGPRVVGAGASLSGGTYPVHLQNNGRLLP